MKKTTVVLSGVLGLALVAGLAARGSAADVNVSGKWTVTTKTARGERTSEMTFLQEGEKLTVTSKNRRGEEVKSSGTVKEAEIAWTTTFQTPQGEMTVKHAGKVEGDTMTGTIDMGGGRTGEWKAEKVK
jgi:ABC-type Na+ efflux pump permease subunit